jgi:hypothetical protein
MVTRLKRKFPIGLTDADAMDFLNEAYRKINQTSKAGYIWQVRTTQVVALAGVAADIQLPGDFDPGKSAWLRATSAAVAPTLTTIPYKSFQDFYLQENFTTTAIGQFSAWSFRPIILAAPASYSWVMSLKPASAYPLAGNITFDFTYHSATWTALTQGAGNYFPTPGQFDSLIIDLAEAEYSRIYGRAGWEKIQQQAMGGIMEIIDTYRTDRYDLAGVSDLAIQMQERTSDKTK